MECPFCKIITDKTERILTETEHSFVVLSDPYLMRGHLLVIPKRHIEKLSELSKDERFDLFELVIKMQDKVLEKLSAGCDVSHHFRPFIPNSNLKVAHLHFHIRPRDLDDELYKKVQIFENDIFKKITEEDSILYKNKLFN